MRIQWKTINLLTTNVPIIEKPVCWFALQFYQSTLFTLYGMVNFNVKYQILENLGTVKTGEKKYVNSWGYQFK